MNRFVAFETEGYKVGGCVRAASTSVFDVMKLEAILTSSSTQLTLGVISVQHRRANPLRNLLRVFPATVFLEVARHRAGLRVRLRVVDGVFFAGFFAGFFDRVLRGVAVLGACFFAGRFFGFGLGLTAGVSSDSSALISCVAGDSSDDHSSKNRSISKGVYENSVGRGSALGFLMG
jgi:hypothetical protein